MSNSQEQSAEEIKKHVRHHLIIAVGLVVGTILTVWSSQMDFGSHAVNIAISLAIASIQGFLIAGFYMGLLSEKKMIYSVLVLTVVFTIVMMGMTVWAHTPENVIHTH